MDYGYANYPYAAQTMLTSHRHGLDVGDLGHPSLGVVTDLNDFGDSVFNPRPGADQTMATQNNTGVSVAVRPVATARPNIGAEAVNALIGAAASVAATGISLGVGAAQSSAQRKHEIEMTQQQALLAEQQARLAAMQQGGQSESTGPSTGAILAGVAALAVVGGVVILAVRRKRE